MLRISRSNMMTLGLLTSSMALLFACSNPTNAPGDGDQSLSGGDGDTGTGDGDKGTGDGDGDTGDGDGDTGDGDGDTGDGDGDTGTGDGDTGDGDGDTGTGDGDTGDGDGGGDSNFAGYTVVSASIVDGNSTHWEQGRDVSFDSQGNIVIVGGTSSSNYPTTKGAYDTAYSGPGTDGRGSAGDTDVFVSKFDQSGNMIWSTFLGSFNYDRAYAVEIGPNDDVFIGGRAGDGFPTTDGALQETFAGDDNENTEYGKQDAFITRLAADGGDVVWSTYVGDSGQGIIRDIDVDDSGNVYFAITGATGSLPTPTSWGPNSTPQGWDGFYGKLSSDGTTLLFGNYMGGSGSGNKDGREPTVRVTPEGNVYYLSFTDKADFDCISNGAFDTSHNGGTDLVLAYFEGGDDLKWCTFIGGSGAELVETHGLAVDPSGNAVVAAMTDSSDMPTTNGAFQTKAGGKIDAYVGIFSPAGDLLYGTYYGGSGGDSVEGVAVANNGDIVFSGGTVNSPNCPFVGDQFKTSLQGKEGLVVRLSPDLSQLVFASPYGGKADEEFRGIAVSSSDDVAIVGQTESSDFPTVNAFDSVLDSDTSGTNQGVAYLILSTQYQ